MAFIELNNLIIDEEYLDLLKDSGLDSFEALIEYADGEVVKKKATRSVMRLEVKALDGTAEVFYLKRHREKKPCKVSSLFKLPEGARNEWDMTISLAADGFDVMVPVAFGERHLKGRMSETLTLTKEVSDTVRLSDYIPALKGTAGARERLRIVGEMARLVKRFHDSGYNHQDMYLVHFFFRSSDGKMFLMDLQRVHKRVELPVRWRVKDLAQFVFSGRGAGGLSSTDLVRFGHIYLGKDKFESEDKKLIAKVLAKAARIERHDANLRERAKRG
ncbi:MAG: hypothetical protein KAS88_03970 [Deltaproteobacteria bacterium]|nr:hypothetical protein [Deltaproteobacteria bacterium]